MNTQLKNLDNNIDVEEEQQLPYWVVGKNQINEHLFCQGFMYTHPLKCINDRFYDLDGLVDENALKHEIYNYLLEGVCYGLSAKVTQVLDALRHFCYSEEIEPDTRHIHVANGKLAINGEFSPFKEFTNNRLNVTYDNDLLTSQPEEFLKFLDELLDKEDIKTFQEYLGYMLIPTTKAQKMMFIIGQGGEGKSRLGIILREIFKNNMIEGNFHRIETDRFFRYNLVNKLCMIDDDTQIIGLPSTGYIKTLVTAETKIDVEAKGKQSSEEYLYTRLLCFGNGSPKALYDKSKGFSRRLLILTTKPVPKDRVNDPNIADKFIKEKDKIFFWGFRGLQRLVRNNYEFTVSQKTKKNIEEATSDSCNIIDFLKNKDTLMYGENLSVASITLYNCYLKWCEENALNPLRRDSFVLYIRQNQDTYNIKYSTHIMHNGKEVRGFKGIATGISF